MASISSVRIATIVPRCNSTRSVPPKMGPASGGLNSKRSREVLRVCTGGSGGGKGEGLRNLSLRCTTNSSEVEQSEEIITGEWPENFSLLNYDDLRAFLEPDIFKDKMNPSAFLGEVMSSTIRTATADQTVEEITHHFDVVSGLPVIDEQFKCIGVISKKDRQRASNGLSSKLGEIMSAPAITLPPNKTVLDAAAVMLKEKIHRIPIVNEEGQLVGIVTRSDIFKVLEGLPS